MSKAEGSGMPIREYCRKHGLDEGQIYHWRHILEMDVRSSKTKAPEPGFVLVRAAAREALNKIGPPR